MKVIKGKYHHGVVDLLEKPLSDEERDVLVIFPDKDNEDVLLKMKEESLAQFWKDSELDVYNRSWVNLSPYTYNLFPIGYCLMT